MRELYVQVGVDAGVQYHWVAENNRVRESMETRGLVVQGGLVGGVVRGGWVAAAGPTRLVVVVARR